ncbi:Fe(3+)-hydroxamate ABC transporter permease FhuB [Marinobacter caseinilyticus]|uniref:Fe(3+)-hydroxamate ABC transporter permease FhuB n=1 Tax=Marinobacter caseinilyticus TaxID=2692195 RepID=UPI001408F7A3|nr:Fe(3+)-hydroxamate ABC transporter permease FhuB [Marinobacter caseinilyticus]
MSTSVMGSTTRLPVATAILWAVALAGASLPWLGQVPLSALWQAFSAADSTDYRQILLHYSWAPRFAMAIVIGFGLGLAGATLQQVLGNPLASPSTLGVASGAQLALAVATLYAPSVLAFSADLIALAGGLLAAGLVVALTCKMGFSPVTVILAGLVISFFLGALNAALLLFHGEYLGNLFIWGAGSLVQNDWSQFVDLWPRVVVLGLALVLLIKPLQLLQLGAGSAHALGARVAVVRLLALFLVVLMTASVVSRVGVVAFVGLAAPVLARLLGARTLRQKLFWSTLLGGALLLLADTLAQWATTWTAGSLVPTGAATALIGGPVILLALNGLRNNRHMPGDEPGPAPLVLARRPLPTTLWVMSFMLVAIVTLAIGWSPGLDGWHWTPPTDWAQVWHWRGPRLLAAIAAGVALGLAGTVIQRLTGNVMASPEVLGISGGAGMAMVLLTLFGLHLGRPGQLLAGTAGGMTVLLLLLALSRRHTFAGHPLLLGGVAIYVFMDAGLRLVLAGGGSDAVALLNWMSGSTWLVTNAEALALAAATLLLGALTVTGRRALTLLPLGHSTAAALGLNVARARLRLMVLAAALTAAATMVIGPLSFVGLMAPHLARVLGQQTVGRQLMVAALAGAMLMALADYLARVLLFPNQLPAGLLAALVGGVYFLWGLSRHDKH